jgi:NRPS condensation-like uncharacterized protein
MKYVLLIFFIKILSQIKKYFCNLEITINTLVMKNITKFEIHWNMEGFKHTKLSNIRVGKDIVSPLIHH